MTNQQAKLNITAALIVIVAIIWLIVEYVTWTHVGIYLLIAVPLLILICRGIDTDASELNENESK